LHGLILCCRISGATTPTAVAEISFTQSIF